MQWPDLARLRHFRETEYLQRVVHANAESQTGFAHTSLDMSSDPLGELEQSLSDSSAEIADVDSVLPDMFEDTGDAPRTKLSGKVLTKEEA